MSIGGTATDNVLTGGLEYPLTDATLSDVVEDPLFYRTMAFEPIGRFRAPPKAQNPSSETFRRTFGVEKLWGSQSPRTVVSLSSLQRARVQHSRKLIGLSAVHHQTTLLC